MFCVAYDEYESLYLALNRKDKFWSGKDEHGEDCFIKLKGVVQIYQRSSEAREASILDSRAVNTMSEGPF